MFRAFVAFLCSISIALAPVSAQVQTSNQIDQFIEMQQTLLDEIPHETIDYREFAKSLPGDHRSVQRWVQSNTRLLPYSGSLKGAEGVFFERMGSSLDRSLLLAEMLRARGERVRLAKYQLTDDAKKSLLASLQLVETPELKLQFKEMGPANLSSFLGLSQQEIREVTDNLGRAAKSSFQKMNEMYWELVSRLQPKLLELRADDVATTREKNRLNEFGALDEYWTVELESSGKWEVLTVDQLRSNLSSIEHVAIYEIDALPSSYFHSVDVIVNAVIEEDEEQKSVQLVSRTFRSSDMEFKAIEISLEPFFEDIAGYRSQLKRGLENASDPEMTASAISEYFELVSENMHKATHWLPVISANGLRQANGAVSTSGTIIERDQFLNLETKGQDHDGHRLQSIEIEFNSYLGEKDLGSDVRNILRYNDAGSLERGSLNNLYSIQTRRYSAEEIQYRTIRTGMAAADLQSDEISLEKTVGLGCYVCDAFGFLRWNIGPNDKNSYLGASNIVGFNELTFFHEGSTHEEAIGIDIVFNEVGVLHSGNTDPLEIRVQQGIRDSIAETGLLSLNLDDVESGANVSSKRDTTISEISFIAGLPSETKPRQREFLASYMEQDYRLMSILNVSDTSPPHFWRFEPRNGTLLAIGPNGAGQGRLSDAPFVLPKQDLRPRPPLPKPSFPKLISKLTPLITVISVIATSNTDNPRGFFAGVAQAIVAAAITHAATIATMAAWAAYAVPGASILAPTLAAVIVGAAVIAIGATVFGLGIYLGSISPTDWQPNLSSWGLWWGDPHVTTIDGLAYDFQAVGEFVKLRSKVDNFEVQVRQEPWRNSTDLSQNTAVAVNLHGMRVGIYTNGISEFVINGEPILGTKFQREFNTGGAVERNGNEFVLRWVDGSKLDVKVYPDSHLDIKLAVSERRRAKVEGLLGNYDGNAGNDLTSRDGRVVRQTLKHGPELYDIVGDSWRISNEESLFAYQPGQSTQTFTIKGFPSRYLGLRDFDQQSVQKAKEICLAKGIPSGPMLDGCIFDVAATGEDAFADSAAAILDIPAQKKLPPAKEKTAAVQQVAPAINGRISNCQQYAEQAVRQYQASVEMGCGFDGPRWQSNFGNHFGWCQVLLGGFSRFAIDEDLARQKGLKSCSERPGQQRQRPKVAQSQNKPAFFVSDFSQGSFGKNLIDLGGGYQKQPGQMRNLGSRNYVKTAFGNYNSRDFIAELTYTQNGGGGPAGVFFGLGAARLNMSFYGEPYPSVFFLDYANDFRFPGGQFFGTQIRLWAKADDEIRNANKLFEDFRSFSGLAKAMIKKSGDTLRFEVDLDHNGSSFEPDVKRFYVLSVVAPFLRDGQSNIFFGTGHQDVVFHNFSVRELN